MDIVFIRGLEIRAIIGAQAWERQVKQVLVVNLDMDADVRAAATDDDIEGKLNYSTVAEAVEEHVRGSQVQLVETLAEQIAKLVMTQFGVKWLRLELIKPRPLSGRHVVGVVIERGTAAQGPGTAAHIGG